MTEELKPCPCLSCKSNRIIVGDDRNATNELYGYVLCLDCGLKMEAFKGNWENARKLALVKWNRRASPWVSVEDGLPKSSDFMAVMDGHETWRRAFYCDGDWFDEDERLLEGVTHWMPIPEIEG